MLRTGEARGVGEDLSWLPNHLCQLPRGWKGSSVPWKKCQKRWSTSTSKQTFFMENLRGFNSCLQRQVNETVRITSSKVDIVMNSKSEFHQAPIVRVTVAAGLEREQGEEEEVYCTFTLNINGQFQ